MKKYLVAIFAFFTLAVQVAHAQTTTRTISGDILKINIGDDGRYQIYHRDINNFGTGQIFPSSSALSDYGWFVVESNKIYEPLDVIDEYNYTNTSISNVTGTGSASSPYSVTATGQFDKVTFEKTDTYTNGENFFRQSITFSNPTNTDITLRVYLGGDIYLAHSDSGVPIYQHSAPGGKICPGSTPANFSILIFGVSPKPDSYTATEYGDLQRQLRTKGDLNNSVTADDPANPCSIDNSAAVSWHAVNVPANGSTSIRAVTSFGDVPPPDVVNKYTITTLVNDSNAGSISCTATSVSSGGSSTCSVTVNTGYQFDNWGNDCSSAGTSSSCALTNITSDKTVSAFFSRSTSNSFTITTSVNNPNAGSISCTALSVQSGGNSTCSVTVNTGYTFDGWRNDCLSAGTSSSCALTNITSNKTVSANFSRTTSNNFTITTSVNDPNAGSISCTTLSVQSGGNSTCSVTVNNGYNFDGWGDDCSSARTNTSCSLTNITSNKTASARFSRSTSNDFTVTASVNDRSAGSIACTPTSVPSGETSRCAVTSVNGGYKFDGWGNDCGFAGTNSSCTLTNITSNKTVLANFSRYFTITTLVHGPNAGSISCTATSVSSGGNSTCSVTVNRGYTFDGWGDDCSFAGTNASCTLTNITSNKTASARFSRANNNAVRSVPSSSAWALLIMLLGLMYAGWSRKMK